MATMHDILRWTLRWIGSGKVITEFEGKPSCDTILTDTRAHAIVPHRHQVILTDVRAHAEAEEC